MLIKQNITIVKKIEIAFDNFIKSYVDEIQKYTVDLHQHLSNKKVVFLFKKHKNLPSPIIENLPELRKIDNFKFNPPSHLFEMEKIGLKIKTLLLMAKKSENLPDFKFILPEDEVELINDWAQNKSFDK